MSGLVAAHSTPPGGRVQALASQAVEMLAGPVRDHAPRPGLQQVAEAREQELLRRNQGTDRGGKHEQQRGVEVHYREA